MTKVCNDCKIEKPLADYYVVQSKSRPTPRTYHICKPCSAIKAKKYKEYYRDWELQKKYGISMDEYKKACELREKRCDICSKQVDTMHVDHSHKTGRVRGYLCGSCNRGIGLLQDDPVVLRLAATYLENNNDKDSSNS